MTFSIGENVGAYRIVEQLGQGGMATVYKAYHAALDRYVAIKVLHTAFKADPTFLARFQREARVVARLDHPNIVPVHDYAEHGGSPYLVMKFIEGETLKARLMRAPMALAEIHRVVEAVGAGLDYAHRRGILHRDIKPSNVMLAQEGNLYIADFGLARIAMAGESTISMDTMLGTPHYMSPEQAKGVKELDAGTDLYSFGVVIYELMVGRVPFNADTPFAIIHDHIFTPLPLPHVVNPQVTEPVERFLLKALAKERADRYPDVLALIKAFREATAAELSRADTLPMAPPELIHTPSAKPVEAPAFSPTLVEPASARPVISEATPPPVVSVSAPPVEAPAMAETVVEPASARPAILSAAETVMAPASARLPVVSDSAPTIAASASTAPLVKPGAPVGAKAPPAARPAGKRPRWLAWGGLGLVGLLLLIGLGFAFSKLIGPGPTKAPGTAVAATAGPATAKPATVKPATPAPGKPVAVRWFIGVDRQVSPEEQAVEQKVVDAFNAAHPEIKLTLEVVASDKAGETLWAEIAAGNAPDIVGPMGRTSAGYFRGAWLDLTPYLKDYDYSDFEPLPRDLYNWPDEGLVSIPFAVYPGVLFYNRQLFDQAKVPYPPQRFGKAYENQPWTMDTLAALAQRLTRNGQYGFMAQWENWQLAALFGSGSLVTSDFQTAQIPEPWRAAWRWYYAGIWDQQFIPSAKAMGGDPYANMFSTGRVAMAYSNIWYTCCLDPQKVPAWDLAVVPTFAGQTTAPLDMDTFYIPKASAHPQAAVAVLEYLVGEAAPRLHEFYESMPARRSQRAAYFQRLDKKFAPNQINWDVVEASLAYPDIPNHEASVPNYPQVLAREAAFYEMVVKQSGLDMDAELEKLRADLQAIYASAAPSTSALPQPSGAITLWHVYESGSADERTLIGLIKNAQAQYPDLKTTIVPILSTELSAKYQASATSRAAPDMVLASNDNLGEWVSNRMVLQLDSYLKDKLGAVSASGVEGMKVDGKLYGVPESARTVALYYNRALIDKAPTTTAELLAAVKSGKGLSLSLNAYHLFGFTGAFGGRLLDDSGQCVASRGGWAEALQYLLDLKAAGAVIVSDYVQAETLFREGKVSMFVNGPWALANYKQALGDKLGVALIPAGPKGNANPLNGIDGFYVNPNSQNAESAVALALFLTSKEASQVYSDKAGHVPIRSDMAASDPLLQAFAQASAQGFPRPQSREFANYWNPFGEMWTKVLEGGAAPVESVKAACDAMNKANGK